jgi:pantoate--beta-alanine ligase
MGFSTAIDVGEVAKPLCGKYRPGHFSGVATVVARLFGIVKPQKAYFGQKDIQQCLVIQRMVEDLALPVELEICPTVREQDGLAMSSRNRYLSKEAREIAPVIYRALRSALALVGQAKDSVASETVLAEAKKILQTQPKIEIQYLELRSFPLLEAVEVISGPTVFAFAGFLEGTRLIDNIILEPRT